MREISFPIVVSFNSPYTRHLRSRASLLLDFCAKRENDILVSVAKRMSASEKPNIPAIVGAHKRFIVNLYVEKERERNARARMRTSTKICSIYTEMMIHTYLHMYFDVILSLSVSTFNERYATRKIQRSGAAKSRRVAPRDVLLCINFTIYIPDDICFATVLARARACTFST